MARFKVAGVQRWQSFLIKWLGLFAAAALLSIPIVFIIGPAAALLSTTFVTAFGLLSGRLFEKAGARALFIFFAALAMYFASGGIVPFVFLPHELLPMRWFSINYWVAVL